MCKSLKNEKGGMLVYSLLVFLIFTILGVALMAYTYSDVKLSQVDQKQQGAFYIAEAGANEAFHRIKEEIYLKHEAAPNKEVFFSTLQAYLDSNWNHEIIDDFEDQLGANPSARVKVEQTGTDPYTFVIHSTGMIGEQERIVTKPFTVHYRKGGSSLLDLPDGVAGIFRDRARLVGSASIDGHMYVLSDSSSTIELTGGGGRRISDTIFVPEIAMEHAINPNITHGIQTHIDRLPEEHNQDWFDRQLVSVLNSFPDPFPTSYPIPEDRQESKDGNTHKVFDDGHLKITDYIVADYTWEVTENTSLKSIELNSSRVLNIDTKNKTIDLVVGKLLNTEGHINIIGGGKINLYIEDELNLGSGSSSVNKNGNPEQLNVFYAGSEKLNVSNNQRLNGSLYIKSADLQIINGGNFKGYIISGGNHVELRGGTYSDALILAPRASINLLEGAHVNGVVIGKLFNADGGTKINYKKFDTSLLPPIESIGDDGGGEIIETGATIEIE